MNLRWDDNAYSHPEWVYKSYTSFCFRLWWVWRTAHLLSWFVVRRSFFFNLRQSSSSLDSGQSTCPSQRRSIGMHGPFSHENSPAGHLVHSFVLSMRTLFILIEKLEKMREIKRDQLTAVGFIWKVLAILPSVADQAVGDALVPAGAAELSALTLDPYCITWQDQSF